MILLDKIEKDKVESFKVAIFLTLAGGFQDSYSYVVREKVFANAQTGNIILLVKSIMEKNFSESLRYIIPITFFMGGVYLSVHMERFKSVTIKRWEELVIFLEFIIIWVVGFISFKYNVIGNSLLSFACGLQVNTFKKVKGLSYANTMCVGNIRSGTDMLCRYHITKNKKFLNSSLHYYSIILIFAIGAGLGVYLGEIIGIKSIWISNIFLTIAYLLLKG